MTVAEVSRSVMKQLGVNMFGSGSTNGISWSSMTENAMGLGKQISGNNFSISNGTIDASLTAMEQAGVMKMLAEPTLTAISGEKATFKVGGEFNMVSGRSGGDVDEDGETSPITYQFDKLEYGIGLEFLPVVLSPGRISLKVRTSVSEPTTEGSGRNGRRRAGLFGTNILSHEETPGGHHGRTTFRRIDDDSWPRAR